MYALNPTTVLIRNFKLQLCFISITGPSSLIFYAHDTSPCREPGCSIYWQHCNVPWPLPSSQVPWPLPSPQVPWPPPSPQVPCMASTQPPLQVPCMASIQLPGSWPPPSSQIPWPPASPQAPWPTPSSYYLKYGECMGFEATCELPSNTKNRLRRIDKCSV